MFSCLIIVLLVMKPEIFVTVLVQFNVALFVLCFCYSSVMFLLNFIMLMSYLHDEGMCILVLLLWYSYACIYSVTYILCLFCWIVEITPQRKLRYYHILRLRRYVNPPAQKNTQSVGKEDITNPVAILMIKVCVQLFNYCFVSYEAWNFCYSFGAVQCCSVCVMLLL